MTAVFLCRPGKESVLLHKIFGGIKMTWLFVTVFAVIAGAFTALMALTVPRSWSFYQIAATFEAWVVMAVFIISNCKKPLEAACKTFVFFLISQPLVYLIQVPFSEMGFQLRRYYPYWFMITLLTFPGAFLGWFITKDQWYSGLILSVMTLLQMLLGIGYVRQCIADFPHMLFAALFCFMSVPVMILGVFRSAAARNTALAVTAAGTVVISVLTYLIPSESTYYMMIESDLYPIDASWTVTVEHPEVCRAELTDENGGALRLKISLLQAGDTDIYLTNGTLTYSTEVSYFKSGSGYGYEIGDLTEVTNGSAAD